MSSGSYVNFRLTNIVKSFDGELIDVYTVDLCSILTESYRH